MTPKTLSLLESARKNKSSCVLTEQAVEEILEIMELCRQQTQVLEMWSRNWEKSRPTAAHAGDIEVRLQLEDHSANTAEVLVTGMGTANMAEGHGSPIFLEKYEGKWTLHVWSDINQEDATHRIDLSGALESNRRGE